jgi:hypothetical protein
MCNNWWWTKTTTTTNYYVRLEKKKKKTVHIVSSLSRSEKKVDAFCAPEIGIIIVIIMYNMQMYNTIYVRAVDEIFVAC